MRPIFYTKRDNVFILEYAASVGLLIPGVSYYLPDLKRLQ